MRIMKGVEWIRNGDKAIRSERAGVIWKRKRKCCMKQTFDLI